MINAGTPSNPIWDELGKNLDDFLAGLTDPLPARTPQMSEIQVPRDPPDTSLVRLIVHPSGVLIIGHRGRGKSAVLKGSQFAHKGCPTGYR